MPESVDGLDRYLSESESRVSGIREGCEKKIVWFDSQRRQRDRAIVYIHGFSASRMETWPLCDRLAEAMGANLFYTRLTGHGQDGDALARATVVRIGWTTEWKPLPSDSGWAKKSFWWAPPQAGPWRPGWRLSRRWQRGFTASILLSPNFFPKNPVAAAALWPPTRRLFESFFGGWRSFSVDNARHAVYWTVRYPVKAIATMMQLVRLSWRIDLKKAAMPVLMMVNPWDRVINVTLAVIRYLTFPSSQKRLVLFRGNKDLGRHVLAGDILSPDTTARVLAIIQAFLTVPPDRRNRKGTQG